MTYSTAIATLALQESNLRSNQEWPPNGVFAPHAPFTLSDKFQFETSAAGSCCLLRLVAAASAGIAFAVSIGDERSAPGQRPCPSNHRRNRQGGP